MSGIKAVALSACVYGFFNQFNLLPQEKNYGIGTGLIILCQYRMVEAAVQAAQAAQAAHRREGTGTGPIGR